MTAAAARYTGRRRLLLFSPGHHEVGGAAQRSRLFAEALAARGWEVRAITRSGTGRRLRFDRQRRLVRVEVPGFGRGRMGALLYLPLATALGLWWSRRATVILAIQLSSPSTVAAICARVSGRPFVVASTSSGSLSEAQELFGNERHDWRRRLVERASLFLAQNEIAATELAALARGGEVALLPNPVQVAPAPLNERPRALYAGRLSEEKDLLVLLAAWQQLLHALPEARLTLAGEGGAYRSVEDEVRRCVAASPALAASVDLPGWVPDTRALLEECDVFVFPSRSEGMSNALLEACAAGRVVVASDIEQNAAVVGADYPLLFRTSDPDALCATLVRAFDDKATRERALATIAARLPRFSVRNVIDRLEELLDGAADNARH